MLAFTILISALLRFSAADPVDRPELILSQRLVDAGFSERASLALQRKFLGLRWEVTRISDLVRQEPGYLNIRRPVFNEILNFLAEKGLRVGLNQTEINYYLRTGHLPEVNGDSEIRVLCLSHGSERVLQNMGIRKLRDMNGISTGELMLERGMGLVRLKEIRAAFQRVRYPVFEGAENCAVPLIVPDSVPL